MNIAVFGLGYVGSVTAVGMAELGHRVVGVDIHAPKVEAMRRGVPPVLEPGLPGLLRKNLKADRLRVTGDAVTGIEEAEAVLIAVGTPSRSDGSVNLEAVQRCVESVATVLAERDDDEPFSLIIRSTVPPGTTERMLQLAAEVSGRTLGDTLQGGMNPEFLREGVAVSDFFEPNLVVLGAYDAASAATMQHLYQGLGGRTVTVDTHTAELVKYANNAFHALKISFANEIGRLADPLGVDGKEVMDVLCMDDKLNISSKYLRPGFAYGGSCLPKDLRALVAMAHDSETDVPLLTAIGTSNERHIDAAVTSILEQRPSAVGVLGIAFKPGTDDVRESPALHLVRQLREQGVEVKMFDAHVDHKTLLGSNRRYIDELLPGWQEHLADSLEDLINSTDVLAVINNEEVYHDALGAHLESNGTTVIDLSGTLDVSPASSVLRDA